eukprot:gene14285-biopygen12561
MRSGEKIQDETRREEKRPQESFKYPHFRRGERNGVRGLRSFLLFLSIATGFLASRLADVPKVSAESGLAARLPSPPGPLADCWRTWRTASLPGGLGGLGGPGLADLADSASESGGLGGLDLRAWWTRRTAMAEPGGLGGLGPTLH